MTPLTDSHCHLDGPRFATQLDAVLGRAREAGVTRVLTVSSQLGDYERVADLVPRLRSGLDGAWAAVGVHPHEAAGFDDAHRDRIRAACAREGVVAVGEIGLDYHYDRSPRDVQRDAFRRQIRLARELGLPIVVHSREASEDTAAVLEEEGAAEVGGVLHCFTSRRELAERAVALGFCVSFSGILTFPSSDGLRAIAASLPADRLMVETDAPYLAPVPHRGKTCEPAMVRATAQVLADARGVSVDEIARVTSAAFDRVFLGRA